MKFKGKRVLLVSIIFLVLALIASTFTAACTEPSPSPTQTPSSEPSPSPSPTPTGPTPAEFYKGKTLTYVVSQGVGTSNDMIARALVPKIKEYTGAESVIIIHKPEAGGMEAQNYMYNLKDGGLTFADVDQADSFIKAIRKDPAMRYNPMETKFVGFAYPSDYLFPVINTKGKSQSITDLQKATGLKGGVAGPFGDYHLILATFSAILDLDIKIAAGMKGGDRVVALANNTLDLSIFSQDYLTRYPDIVPLAVSSTRRFSKVNAPTLSEIAPKDLPADIKAMVDFCETTLVDGNVYIVSPGVPADRIAFLGEALNKALKDNLAEVQKYLELEFTMDDITSAAVAQAAMTENFKAGEQLAATMDKLFEKYKA